MILKSPISIPPDPLPGPRTVGDATNHIKINPDSSRIEYVGSARPIHKQILTVPHYTQGGLAALVGLHANTTLQYGFNDGVTRHLHAFVPIRDDVDVGEDIEFKAVTYGNADISGLTVRNDIIVEKIGSGETTVSLQGTAPFDFTHPAGTTSRKSIVRTLYTLSGSSVQSGDMLQIDFIREGGHANDTLGTSWHIVGLPWIEFTRKQV
ncbi:MAG: hypothetical protein MI923_08030 [Phycisphaerales bacterium]|nr:hypothetical protein [Phycisphaerales bacterium]